VRLCQFISSIGGTGAIIAVLSGPAFAQQLLPGINLYSEGRPLTPDEQEKRKSIDNAYRSTMQKLPDKKKSSDPWDNLRSTNTASPKRQQ